MTEAMKEACRRVRSALDCARPGHVAVSVDIPHLQALVEAISAGDGGTAMIAEERLRQISGEGFDKNHDDEHVEGEMAGAGAAYATFAHYQIAEGQNHRPPPQSWRWTHEEWKPSEDPVRNLVKAGALIAAEIDRLLREREAIRLDHEWAARQEAERATD